MSDIKVDKTIYELLQEVRFELTKTNLSKSGHNGFQNFDYFELKDFVPAATKLFYERGMCPIFNIGFDGSCVEVAKLEIVKGVERVAFQTPTAEPTGNNPIQNLGSKITYLRRYLYLICLDLVENDVVDASDNSKESPKSETKATKKQVDIIRSVYNEENIAKIIEHYNVNNLEELTIKQASEVIAHKKA